MDRFVEDEKMADNVTIGGHDQKQHDENVDKFMEAAKRKSLTLNEPKSVISASSINILGYCISQNIIQPDADRLQPLERLPPHDIPSLRRTLGIFAYYSKWIPSFANRARPLINNKSFPIKEEALSAFNSLKDELQSATLSSINESIPFVVECDASEVAVSATLNQNGRPVAFMSHTLNKSELNYPAVEKEALSIMEAVRKWRHLLLHSHFTLITDQRSVAFMVDNRKRTKIKNSEIQCWRVELAEFSYTVSYRPGPDNVVPDALTRSYCATVSHTNLTDIHRSLCHPGVTRMLHFVKSRNLPFTTEEVKRSCSDCQICAELKRRFFKKTTAGELIKALHPMDRLSIDFKGPLPSSSRNKYLLVIVDEYSRFPFAFPCPDTSSATVMKCSDQIFSLCGFPTFLHSDRGSSFISRELKSYLTEKGISTSNSSPYHPIGNGQVERFNGIIWKSIRLALGNHNIEKWELVLPEVLHSIRSLLSAATNCTPHERFFNFPRRSSFGSALPSWLSPGTDLLRRFVRSIKNDGLVDKMELVDVNPTYARIRHPDGRESSVSIQNLAPYNFPGNNSDVTTNANLLTDCNTHIADTLQHRQVTAPNYSNMPELPAVEQTITNLDSTKISESKQLQKNAQNARKIQCFVL